MNPLAFGRAGELDDRVVIGLQVGVEERSGQYGLRFGIRQQSDGETKTPVPEGRSAVVQGVLKPGSASQNRGDRTVLTSELHCVQKPAEHLRVGLLRLIDCKQYRMSVLFQPVRQPGNRIVAADRPDLCSEQSRNSSLHIDRDEVQEPGRSAQGAHDAST